APYLVSLPSLDPQDEAPWREAVMRAGRMLDLIGKGPDDVKIQLDTFQEEADKLRSLLTRLLRPFAKDALEALVKESDQSDGDVELYRKITAVLNTAFPKAPQRAALWEAALQQDKKLHEKTVKDDQRDNLGQHPTAEQAFTDRQREELEEQKRQR